MCARKETMVRKKLSLIICRYIRIAAMVRQQQHDAGATSILGQQFNGVSQFKDLFQRVLFALLAL